MVQVSQNEMREIIARGKGFILAYRTVYQIDWSYGVGGYVLRKVHYSRSRLPLTRRGRFVPATRETVEELCGFAKTRLEASTIED